MKKALHILIAFCFAIALNACSAPINSDQEVADNVIPETYEPIIGKSGGQLIIRTSGDPKSFNPIVSNESTTTIVTQYIFDGLVTRDPITTEVIPVLAESWEYSEDGLTWTINLKKEVLWNDGEPFTADDVVFTYNEIVYNPEIPNSAADVLQVDGEPFEVKKIDQHTVEFTIAQKFAPFIESLAQVILPKHKYQKIVQDGEFNSSLGIDSNIKDIVGTGPFIIESYTAGDSIKLAKNTNYWKKDAEGKNLPYLDGMVLKVVANDDTALLQFQNGEIDAYSLRGTDYPVLKPQEASLDFTIYNLGATTQSNFIVFNLNDGNIEGKPFVEDTKREIFENQKFRQAISHAIDRDSMVDIIFNGLAQPQWGPTTESSGFFYNPNVKEYQFNIDTSKSLLQEIGFNDIDGDGFFESPDGEPFELNLLTNSDNSQRVKIAEFIRKDLENIGIKVAFSAIEFNSLVTKLTASYDFEVAIMGLTGSIEPHFGRNVWHSTAGLHMWHPAQEQTSRDWEQRIDQIFDDAVKILDNDKRKDLYDEWQVIASEQLPLIYTIVPEKIGATRNKFGNLYPTNLGNLFWNIEEIFIK
jgi:peptide/nickel transport system substrate-binding protein